MAQRSADPTSHPPSSSNRCVRVGYIAFTFFRAAGPVELLQARHTAPRPCLRACRNTSASNSVGLF
eukprot:7152541-Pyramimonas_sp.AAC.1